ncbi:MAG: hypothetical protein ACMUEL_05525 [Flavobacteriales bacterium Tduv]
MILAVHSVVANECYSRWLNPLIRKPGYKTNRSENVAWEKEVKMFVNKYIVSDILE